MLFRSLRRAGFLKHNLWVTPYKSDEKFPGGEFPNQNPRLHEGLPTWVKKDRPLEETDIVLWYFPLTTLLAGNVFLSLQFAFLKTVFCIYRYVFGLTHIPRLEDWPVMPVERIGFMLMVIHLEPFKFQSSCCSFDSRANPRFLPFL